MSRETRRAVLYDAHKKPVELDRSKLPSFRKVSCHSLSDDSVSITAVTTKNNSAHSHSEEKACLRRFVIDIPPISYDSSLPSTSRISRGGRGGRGGDKGGGKGGGDKGGGRGGGDKGGGKGGGDEGGGGGGKKRPMTRGPLHPAKRGRAASTNSRNNADSVVSDFDSLVFDYRQTKPAPPNSAPLGTSRVGGDSVKEVLEIPDSPPSPLHAAEYNNEVALVHSPTPSSSSSTNELTAIQLTSQRHEDTPPSSLPSPSPPDSLTSCATRYTSAQVVSSTHSLAPDEATSQGRPPKQAQWSGEDVNRIDLDADEDCLITEQTTTSRYFGNSRTGQGVNYSPLLPPSSPSTAANTPTDSLASTEAELLQFKKTSANFSRVASNLPQVASSPHSSVPNSTIPQPPALRQSMVQALEDFNRGQSSDVGGDNYRGNVRVPAISVPTSSIVAPRLTNPELDVEGEGEGEGEGDVVISSTTRNVRWAERGGGRGRSVFDVLENNSLCGSSHTNTSSFYGGGGVPSSYGRQQLMAARENNNKKKRLSLRQTVRQTLQGRQAPLIKAPPHTVGQLDFTSTGKTLMSLQKKAQESSNRMTTQVRQSCYGSTHLSMVEETSVDVGTVRIGTLEEIPVSQCLMSSGEICMKLVAKDTPLKYNVYFSDISEWKMNLRESPRCIMMKLHPLAARKLANKLRSQFKLSNCRFLNVEVQHRWYWYWVLRIESHLGPDKVAQIHQWVDNLESRAGERKVKVEREMSIDEVQEFYSELDSQETVSLFSSTPTEDYKPSSSLRDIPRDDFVRRSTRAHNKDGERGRARERVRKILNEEEEEEEEEGAVSYIPKGDPKKIILTYKPEGARVNIEISEMDLDCLEPGVYLNDRVIDFYLMYLWYDVLGTGARNRVHIFSSFFHQRLMDSTRDLTGTKELSVAKRLHDRVKSWTRHVDLFSKDYIILPVCVSSHWFLALICHPGQYKPSPPPTTRRRRKRRCPRPKVLCNTRSRAAKKEGEKEKGGRMAAATGIELISICYSQEDEEEEEGEGEGKNEEEDEESPIRQNSDSSNGGAAVTEDVGMNIHLSSCEEDETLVITGGEGEGGGEGGEGERDGEGEEEEMVLEMEGGNQKEEETNSISEETLEGDGEKDTEQEENKPCIMILDSLEIRRGAVVTRINNYLTEELEVKKKDCSPIKFKLKAVHPKLLPQNNSCDCGVFVLQYVESLFRCLKTGHSPPAMPDDWASYHQTQNKRHQLKSLITRQGAEKNHAQTTPPTSQNHTRSSPPSPELIDIPLDPPL